eukprot:CAMPEP_0172439916 /NCGR_PEP_ID=MMETSP1065-20121228/750_1 /TAXON_ID=265537 /ORGANISM="Amphiprora paludosa, Strain CCMP125" /LENGTH=1312 /DNA_ID=CAMNT_0013188675 /DNA_START=9 /DNA_END=3947 /DNA_ORIENTATION=+
MAEACRPQRYRRTVNHYSDDNPSTFTVKRRRGEDTPSPPPTENAADRRKARAEGRRQRTYPVELPLRTRKVEVSGGSSITSNGHSSNSSNGRGIKRKRRLKDRNGSHPGGHRVASPPSPPPQMDEILSHAVSIQPVLPVAGERPSLAQRYPQLYRENYVGAIQPPGSADQWTRIVEAHKERWVPLQQQGGNNSNIAGSAQSPTQTSSSQENSLLALPAAPWTCFAVRKDDPLYFCVGDAAGNLLLYTSQTPSVCIQTVSTSAAIRESERPVLWSQSQKGVISYPNSVGAVCWHKNIAVVWTRQEVEILDVVQHTTLFCLPLDLMTASNHPKRQAFSFQSLDLHPDASLLLWRPSGSHVLDEATHGEDNVSLYCIDFSDREAGAKRSVIVPTPNKKSDYFCHAAVWDRQSQEEILAVISLPEPQAEGDSSTLAYLCRMTPDGEISQQTRLPESSNVSGRLAGIYSDCVLEQYDDYLFLCTGRGIRCYENKRLTFLTVYGETVALHNKTVGWQACFWIPEPMFDSNEIAAVPGKKKQSLWIERADELVHRSQAEEQYRQQQSCNVMRQDGTQTLPLATANGGRQTSASSMASQPTNGSAGQNSCTRAADKLFSNMLLVGVPHPTRCPSELQSTLYVWKPGQVLPLTTLQAPAGGLLGLHIHPTATTGWRLTCATAKSGQGWQLGATLKSDFAGTMYPVGYQLVNDNTEYLEEEGELDQAMVLQPHHADHDSSPQRITEESELQLALRKSLETVKVTEEKISVLNDDDDDEDYKVLVPSIPDPSLREVFEEGEMSIRSPGRRLRKTPQALAFFPQYKACLGVTKEQSLESSKRRIQPPPPPSDAVEQSKEAFKLKGKRSRTATVEHILQASVDPVLKYKMGILNKEWSKGGSEFLIVKSNGEKNGPDVERSRDEVLSFLLSPTTMKQHNPKPPPPPLSAPSDISAVTPSEPSPTATSVDDTSDVNAVFCAACHDRMVLHTCGKRELPVDTEALERAERERIAAEEEEKKRLRAEKRKIAEAKRREKRRIKKEIEDRQRYHERMEFQRLQILEEQRALNRQQLLVAVPVPSYEQRSAAIAAAATQNTIPKFSELGATSGSSTTVEVQQQPTTNATDEQTTQHGFHSAETVAATTPAADTYPPAAQTYQQTTTDWSAASSSHNYYKSESMSTENSAGAAADTAAPTDGDALAALVGLADSLAPVSTTPSTEISHYDYSGSSDRRSAILAQYSSQLMAGEDPAAKALSAQTESKAPANGYYGSTYDSTAPSETAYNGYTVAAEGKGSYSNGDSWKGTEEPAAAATSASAWNSTSQQTG